MSDPPIHDQETRASRAIPGGISSGDLINDRYRIGRKLGSGGMGDVFLADWSGFPRPARRVYWLCRHKRQRNCARYRESWWRPWAGKASTPKTVATGPT